ncbi:MAG TPA: 50S ribosomal protein L11 methyltransferase [bacterium]|nr:50S ribosomal protein L11 methyltransferase [bacterium]
MKDSWHEARIEVDAGEVELLSHLLHELGCNGVVEEPSVGARATVKAYFDASKESPSALSSRISSLACEFKALSNIRIDVATLSANEWKQNWRQWFKPFEITRGIFVTPSWERFSPEPGHTAVTIDPGMAFGTGLHETTRLCAEAIGEKLCEAPSPLSLLDVGTGSGLLAIIAEKLGAGRIAAVENDPDALAVAVENFAKNGAEHCESSLEIARVEGRFDIVVANILLLTLIELKDELVAKLAPGGTLVLSGITHDQEERLKNAFSPPLAFEKATQMGEWSCMLFKN